MNFVKNLIFRIFISNFNLCLMISIIISSDRLTVAISRYQFSIKDLSCILLSMYPIKLHHVDIIGDILGSSL